MYMYVKGAFQKLIDPSIFITLRENDWRDNHQNRMIIWSIESIHHPDFGKNYPKGGSQRLTARSQVMSFLILGSVIGFILYTYLSHVIMMRKINRQMKAAQLRELVQRWICDDYGEFRSTQSAQPLRAQALSHQHVQRLQIVTSDLPRHQICSVLSLLLRIIWIGERFLQQCELFSWLININRTISHRI
ncbi:hypothetical protein ANCCAN_11273 [Ancylostoma caninum]|uniref:Uncharacterized protein n=1 Tax=Ancylostoma caninum TaxID=29170 RepID=A0A368GEB1_ANCCA|nr:hypothetical protein ANCCAN_11273 [Ancylostoma caninum]